MDSYEQWTREEIARLRAEAQKAAGAADIMQGAFDKWLVSQGRKPESAPEMKAEAGAGLNGHTPRRGRRPAHGNKNALALQNIKAASPNGLTTDEIYSIFADIYGPKYKRSSLRALLWHQKELENIEVRNGRYIIKNKEQAAA